MVFAAGIPLNVWQGRGGMKKAVAKRPKMAAYKMLYGKLPPPPPEPKK
jgi:hypothetical protein